MGTSTNTHSWQLKGIFSNILKGEASWGNTVCFFLMATLLTVTTAPSLCWWQVITSMLCSFHHTAHTSCNLMIHAFWLDWNNAGRIVSEFGTDKDVAQNWTKSSSLCPLGGHGVRPWSPKLSKVASDKLGVWPLDESKVEAKWFEAKKSYG